MQKRNLSQLFGNLLNLMSHRTSPESKWSGAALGATRRAPFFKYNQVTRDVRHHGWSTINERPFKNERGHICTAGYLFLNRSCDGFVSPDDDC